MPVLLFYSILISLRMLMNSMNGAGERKSSTNSGQSGHFVHSKVGSQPQQNICLKMGLKIPTTFHHFLDLRKRTLRERESHKLYGAHTHTHTHAQQFSQFLGAFLFRGWLRSYFTFMHFMHKKHENVVIAIRVCSA